MVEHINIIAAQYINSGFNSFELDFVHSPDCGCWCCRNFVGFCCRNVYQFRSDPSFLLVSEKDGERAASSNFRDGLAQLLCVDSGETQNRECSVGTS